MRIQMADPVLRGRPRIGGKLAAPRVAKIQAAQFGGILLLFAAAALPLTPAGIAISKRIAGSSDLAGLESGRQRLLVSAFGSAVAALPPAESSSAKNAGDLGLSKLAAFIPRLQPPQTGLSASRFGTWMASLAANPQLDARLSETPGLFRRLARFGLSDTIDFDPTASTGATGERLPPLARQRQARPGLLQVISAAAKQHRSTKPAKPEFAAQAFVPGGLFTGLPAFRPAAAAPFGPLPAVGGRLPGRV